MLSLPTCTFSTDSIILINHRFQSFVCSWANGGWTLGEWWEERISTIKVNS